MQQIYSTLFTEAVVERFVKPYTNTDVRQSVFRGPEDEDGRNPQIGNSYINQAFKTLAQGDVYEMSNYLFEKLVDEPTDAGMTRMATRISSSNGSVGIITVSKVSNRVSKQQAWHELRRVYAEYHESLDARMVESRLPKEFFYYNMYDEVSSNIRLAYFMTATASFGRNGENAPTEQGWKV